MRFPFSFWKSSVGATAPTVTAIDWPIGDTAGGEVRTLMGTYFTGATAVTVDALAAIAFSVISDTEIILVMPAHAAAASMSILVTTPAGTNAANTLYEYWSPAELSCTGLWDRGNYQDTALGTWPGLASAGTSAGRDLTQATPNARPIEVGLEPVLDGADDFFGATFTLATLLPSSTDGSVVVLFNPAEAKADAAVYANPGLVSDGGGGNFSLSYSDAGVRVQVFSGGESKGATVPTLMGALVLAKVRYTGGFLDLAVNGNAFAAPVAITALATLATGLFIGKITTAFLHGSIRTLIFSGTGFTNAQFDKIVNWAKACRGLPQ